MNAIRVGNCSGYYGDRLSAMREMLSGGQLDYLTGDYLAELTMLILGRDQMKDPALGYAKTFIRQMSDCMALAKEGGVKIVTNAGGLNPAGCAERLREIATEHGIEVSIAHVEGDNLKDRAAELGLDTADSQGGGNLLTANAYLGAFGIAAALDRGADIVVTGRVTDASVVVGPAIAHHGWGRDDLDKLAGAVVAGHVIECGTQATGGNYSGFAAHDIGRPGFPIAEIAADGSCVITKHDGTTGAVTIDTVTAQLVYEIADANYLGPDVTTRLDTIRLAQLGPDRVAITDARGSAPPATAKVCLNLFSGFRNSVEFVLTGLDIDDKADLIIAQMEHAMAASGRPEFVEWQLDRTDVDDPQTQAAATSTLRCHVKDQGPDPVGRAFTSAAVELALASYPGFTMTRPPGVGTPYGTYRPAYVRQTTVPHTVILADGERLDIAPPDHMVETVNSVPAPDIDDPPAGRTDRAPLGRLAFARSGDKGGDANLGLWIPSGHPNRGEAYAWLANFIDVEAVRALLPETEDLDMEIYALPNLCAVNIVIRKLLGEGVAASTRFDPQAKALGEWIRARYVEIPADLLKEAV